MMDKINLSFISIQENIEKYLVAYTRDTRKNNCWVTILIILQKVFELFPLFNYGKDVLNFMETIKN